MRTAMAEPVAPKRERIEEMDRQAWQSAALLAGLVAAAGCGTKSHFQFDELDLVPAQEELTEFSLGTYVVPIPVAEGIQADAAPKRNAVEFGFELIAVVKRDQKSRIADSWERHEGKIRDRVIRECRRSSLDDLETLKAHLMDAVQSQLGEREIRQLVIADVKSEGI
jgi:flagellar basal body-associated protein FliL